MPRNPSNGFQQVFGDDFYLELQRHKPTVPNAAQDTFPKQQEVNKHLIELSKKLGVQVDMFQRCAFY